MFFDESTSGLLSGNVKDIYEHGEPAKGAARMMYGGFLRRILRCFATSLQILYMQMLLSMSRTYVAWLEKS